MRHAVKIPGTDMYRKDWKDERDGYIQAHTNILNMDGEGLARIDFSNRKRSKIKITVRNKADVEFLDFLSKFCLDEYGIRPLLFI